MLRGLGARLETLGAEHDERGPGLTEIPIATARCRDPSSNIESNVQDGARNALIGYLYQMLGVAGLRAIGASLDQSELSCRWIGELRHGHVIHEAYGQDAVVVLQAGSIIALQFKHSWDPQKSLDLDQFREIIDAFDQSSRELPPGRTFEQFVVFTNRNLSDSVKALYELRTAASVPARLMPHGNSDIRKSANTRHGSPGACDAAWHDILRRLLICPSIPIVQWEQMIVKYAESIGVHPEEMRQGIYGLIGELVAETAKGTVAVSLELLNRHLARASDVRSLSLRFPDAAHQLAREHLIRFTQNSLGIDLPHLISRRLLATLAEELSGHPIVFVIGRGGCGKSTAAAQFLLERYGAALPLAQVADSYHDGWLTSAFNRCRSRNCYAYLAHDLDVQVIARMRIANRNEPLPLLLVDLDGLDETRYGERAAIRRLIRLVCEQSDAGERALGLVLTARSERGEPEDALLGLISEWCETGTPQRLRRFVGLVDVLPFGTNELAEAADAVDPLVAVRIKQFLATASASSDSNYVDDAVRSRTDQEIVNALLLPAMWGAFVDQVPAQRQLILDGETQAVERLASAFVRRFCLRAHKRRPALEQDRIIAGLRAAAQVLQGPIVRLREAYWVVPSSDHWNRDEANHLYRDAVSYGLLIEESESHFRWSCEFVRHSLIKEAGE